jgi:hypothetical protein
LPFFLHKKNDCTIFALAKQTVIVAQLVRASDCGSEGRGFETPHSPKKTDVILHRFFLLAVILIKSNFFYYKIKYIIILVTLKSFK